MPTHAGTIDTKLYLMEREIDVLARVLEIARTERDELNIARLQAQNCRAAIHRLPQEILREIFMMAGGRMVQSTCCLWRNLVLDMPRLWSCISFGCLKDFSGLPLKIERANLWIERSRSVPLDLIIALPDNSHRSSVDEIARLFAPHWTRCRSLVLSYRIWRRGTLGPPFPFSNSMPLLQRLDLSIEGPYELGEGHIERVVIPLADYPRLCSLNLHGTYPRGLSISFGESIASSITCISLRINQFDLSTLSRLIVVCPALRSLSWRSPRNQSIATGPMINLPPSMVELKISGETAMDIAKFRGQNVQSLRIDYLRSTLGSQLPHYPFPNLRKLDLQCFDSFSSLCPFIQVPYLEEMICGEGILERFTSGELDMFIEACRNLRTLKIKGWFYPPLAEDGMCAEEFARRLLDRQPSPKISLFSWASHASWPPGIVFLSQQFPERFSIFSVPEPA
jgi:hypothetical protein